MGVSEAELMAYPGTFFNEPVAVSDHVLIIVTMIIDVTRRRADRKVPKRSGAFECGGTWGQGMKFMRDSIVRKAEVIGADFKWLCAQVFLSLPDELVASDRSALLRCAAEALRWHLAVGRARPHYGAVLSYNIGRLLRKRALPFHSGIYDDVIVTSRDPLSHLRVWVFHFPRSTLEPPTSIDVSGKPLEFCLQRLEDHENGVH